MSAASQQVSEFLQHQNLNPENKSPDKLSELADLQERAGRQPKNRYVLQRREQRLAKLSIETCRIHPVTGEVLPLPPLEPWTGPKGSLSTYAEIMLTEDGAYSLADYSGGELAALKWMRDEELISVGEDGIIHALSDARARENRAYPGAPVNDRRASIGHYLRGLARGLVLAAISNLSAGRSVRRSRKARKRETLSAEGIALTAAEVCAEANRIRSKRGDLAGYRYLSLEACRKLIRLLIDGATLDEISPPVPVRRRRSWVTLPRVIRRYVDAALDRLGRPVPAESSLGLAA